MSMLLASLLTMGQLSGNSEITAMRSGGMSFRRIAMPILAAGFVVSLFSVVWAEKVVPPAKAEYERIIQQEIKNNTKPRTQDHILLKNISKGQLTRLTYARTFDEKAGVMKDITIEDWDKAASSASSARLKPNGRMGRGSWKREPSRKSQTRKGSRDHDL